MTDDKNSHYPNPGKGAPGQASAFPEILTARTRLLNPIDRFSEVVFGLIMALTFTGTLSVATAGRTEVREMLIGAIGCNIAWGLVDAVMYTLARLAEKGHGRMLLHFVRKAHDHKKAREYIAEELPPLLSSVLKPENLEEMRNSLLKVPESSLKPRLTGKDFKIALGIFLLVFISTFPVALPFAIIHNVELALRVSNGVAILLMFISGWYLARYGGYNKWVTGLTMSLLGTILVLITIALGG